MGGYILLTVLVSIVGFVVQGRLKSKFSKYSRLAISSRMSGAEIAREMLHYYGIRDVNVVEGRGMLTDHYNPASKTVSLSPDVYRGASIAAAAVAAHECGHAVQHAKAYAWLQLRSSLVPIVSIASNLQQYLLMAALGFFGMGGGQTLLLITIIAFAITTAFALITLPVEFDASRRALVWLNQTRITQGAEQEGAKDALWWAAMTYVASALGALVTLVYLIMRFNGND